MKVLVTGASGFVGSAVLRRLLSAGFEARALVRRNSPRANLEGLAVEVVKGDILDRASLDKALRGAMGSSTWPPTTASGRAIHKPCSPSTSTAR